MSIREELEQRIAYLKSISPAGAETVFNELMAALQGYFTRDSEFELQMHKTMDKVIVEEFHLNWQFEHQELIDPWIDPKDDAPLGYEDLRELFDASGTFSEIANVSDREFKAAFYTETQNTSGGGGNSTAVYKNRYVDKWVANLAAAPGNELESLKKIMQYCAIHNYNLEEAMIFEHKGRHTNKHEIEYYAKRIFYERGYGWVIDLFNLPNYKPSYSEILPSWTEEVKSDDS
ncbi:MAG: hypothetical protein IJ728_02820 [Selenomonadaceae bacterium]|nr:hypothetical protein [Selenomonadaceae bacterium]MBR1728438.1 hypothetical protein [Selenomonadaceae bacterium]